MGHAAIVLLSGGFDSVAALCWASARYRRLIAISFLYGQPNVDQESAAAGQAAEALGIEWRRLAVSDAVRGARALESPSPVVPGRNLVFLSIAASHAAHEWQLGRLDLIIGSNVDDADQFPDCRLGTLLSMTETLSQGLGRECRVVAPWIDRTKSQILYAIKADPTALAIARQSWSCYRATGPCGECVACLKRAAAFAAQGVTDGCEAVTMRGGDRSRER